MKKPLICIDIFAGCGGLSLGLYNSGWNGLFAVEKNADAFKTLKHNLIGTKKHFNWPDWLEETEHDINEVINNKTKELEDLKGKITLVAGGPPCQGFSMAGKRDRNDNRNRLVISYIKFIKLVQPEAIIFENVFGFTLNFTHKNGTKKYSTYVERSLNKLGYNTHFEIINMSDFGVPQKRKRYILVALKNKKSEDVFKKLFDNRVDFFLKRNMDIQTSVYDAISDLEFKHGTLSSPDSNGYLAGKYGPILSNFQKSMRLDIINLENSVDSHRFVNHRTNTINLHKELQLKVKKGRRITPKDSIVSGLNRRGVTVLDPNAFAPTITSIPDELIHYSEPRILTVREQARIQSFPDWFQFKGKYTSGGILRKSQVPRYTQVGNAIPPLFAEQIGRALLEVIQNDEN